MIEEFVSRVFAARDISHRAHWRTGSYSMHMALGDFYDGVIDAVDEIVEVYQGAFGLIGDFDVETTQELSISGYLQEQADWIAANRDGIANGNDAVRNLIDGVGAIYRQTIYKLNQLS
jgi:DNA-binding ferritin-like protein